MSKVYLEGPVMWAKVFEHNMDTGEYAPEGGQFTIQIGLNEEDSRVVQGWNRMYLGKDYEEYPDLKFYTFKRKNHVYKKDGDLIEEWSGPPKVLNIDGSDWDGGLIGNGSTAVVKLDVTSRKIKTKTMTFVRLEVVAVKELVEYVGKEDTDEVAVDVPKKAGKGGRPF